jgi:hypothetical protein
MSSDSILEKLPLFDGSLRRKIIVGALVVLSFMLSHPDTPVWMSTVQQSNSLWNSSLLAVIFFLLVYAVGSAIELLGEVSIVRAISGALWGIGFFVRMPFADSWLGLKRQKFTKRPVYRYILKPFLVALIGFLELVVGFVALAPYYFVCGVFGRSVYRIGVGDLISDGGKVVLNALPSSIREGLNDPIGGKADLAFIYLVESFTREPYRQWARNLVARCKDVLALANTALVIVVFLGVVLVYPFYRNYENWQAQQLSTTNLQITNIDIHFGRLIPIIASKTFQLYQSNCKVKDPETDYCKGLQIRTMQIADIGSQSGRAMFFWGLPTMQFIENSVSIRDLKDITNIINRLEYGRDTLFHQFAIRDFRQDELGKGAAEEIIKLSHETIGALKQIENEYKTGGDKYYRWFWYSLLAPIFSAFMYFWFWATIKNTLVSLIEGLAVQPRH